MDNASYKKLALTFFLFTFALLLTYSFVQKHPASVPVGRAVAEVVSSEGEVRLRNHQTQDESFIGQRAVFTGETLVTDRASSLYLRLRGGTLLRLKEHAQVRLEDERPARDVVAVSLLRGQVQVVEPGQTAQVRFWREGSELTLSQLSAPPTALKISSTKAELAQPQNVTAIAAPERDSEKEIESKDKEQKSQRNQPKSAGVAPELGIKSHRRLNPDFDSLTDQEISRGLSAQGSLLQRCYLGFLSRARAKTNTFSQVPSGQVVLRFEVKPTGRAEGARVVDSSINDDVFKNCVTDVVERAAFRSFPGHSVVVAEFPLKFE